MSFLRWIAHELIYVIGHGLSLTGVAVTEFGLKLMQYANELWSPQK